jgi:hypothetical protein
MGGTQDSHQEHVEEHLQTKFQLAGERAKGRTRKHEVTKTGKTRQATGGVNHSESRIGREIK